MGHSKPALSTERFVGKDRMPSKERGFSNHEVVTLAVFLLGGDSRYLDTEDIAVKANEVAPGRFAWRKYPDQINIENVRTFLSDAKKPKNGGYLIGSGSKGWMLTERGLEFAKKGAREFQGVDLSRSPLSQREKQRRVSEQARMLASEAFSKFIAGNVGAVTRQEAEAFFRIDDYIVGKAREGKIARILNTFGDDPQLGSAVKELANKVRAK